MSDYSDYNYSDNYSEPPPMSIIEGVRDFIKTFEGIGTDAPVWVQFLDNEPVQYAILPIGGTRVISEDILGNKTLEYLFALQSMESTAEDIDRLESAGFYESFAEWLDEQTKAENLPKMPRALEPIEIEALGWGILFQQGESETAVYQIQCRLVYAQKI